MNNSIHSFTASDLVALGRLFYTLDKNGDEMIDPDEFKTISFKFAKNNFVFNGPESLDSLNIQQLDVLRHHKWKRRKAKELAEGEEPDNAQNQ